LLRLLRQHFHQIPLYLARRLVDAPDAVRVEQVDRDDATVLQLWVAPDDVGKVIGRQGRIARALRTVVRASAARDERRVMLEIMENRTRWLARRGASDRPALRAFHDAITGAGMLPTTLAERAIAN